MSQHSASYCLSCIVLLGLTIALSAQEGRFIDVRPIPGLPATATSVDTGPSVTADELTIVFTSSRPGGLGGRDLFMAKRPSRDDPFGEIVNLGALVNSAGWEHNAHISPNGLVLYFASDGMLYRSSRATRQDRFTNKESLGTCVNLPGIFQTDPSATTDELELYFFVERPGGAGGFDVWTARRDTLDQEYCDAKPVPMVNTSANEMHCAISANGLVLIFDSPDRPPTKGGNDIWIATRPSRDEAFSPAVTLDEFSLGSEINSPSVDYTPSLSPNWPEHGSKLYFSRAALDYRDQQLFEATWITDPPQAVPSSDLETPEVRHEVLFDGTESFARGERKIVTYEWDFGDGNTAQGAVAPHEYLAPGRYRIQLTVTDDKGRSDVSAMSITVVCGNSESDPWHHADIGDPLYPGSSTIEVETESPCLSMCAGGRDLSRSFDECHFVYQTVTGNVALTARVAQLNGSLGSKGGIMLRESLEQNSRSVALLVEDSVVDRLLLQTRDGATFTQKAIGNITTPSAWLRLSALQEGTIASSSTDGVDWVEVGRATFAVDRGFLAGAAATGRDFNQTPFYPADVRFCELSIQPLETAKRFHRGDPNSSGTTDISDAVAIFGFLFLGEPPALSCQESADVNNDGTVDISDGIYLLSWLFIGGPAPMDPGPTDRACGEDPDPVGSPGDLGCVEYSPCP